MSTKDTEGTMTPGSGATTKASAATAVRRRLLLAGGAALLVAALVAVLLMLGANDEDTPPSAAGSATPTSPAEETLESEVQPAAPLPEPQPQPTGPTENADELPPALPAVALDAPAEVDNGIIVTVPVIDAIQGSAEGPGNVAGPALRVAVRITNDTGEAVSLDGVTVNMAYGADGTAATPLEDRSQRPFKGTVSSGEAADGVYVFTVPADERDAVTIEVGYRPGAARLLFTGSTA